jgi:hypothetical protein
MPDTPADPRSIAPSILKFSPGLPRTSPEALASTMSKHALGMRRTLSTLTRKPECRSNAVKTIGELVDEQCPVCDDGTFIAEGTEAIA